MSNFSILLYFFILFILDILNYFDDIIENHPETTPALAAVKTLIEIVKNGEGMELYYFYTQES